MDNLIPLRVRSEDGLLALRDGIVFVLFIRKPHSEICEAVVDILDDYSILVGPEKLQWVHDRGEFFQPYTAQRQSALRRRLAPSVATEAQHAYFALKGECGEGEAGAYRFAYRGRDMKGRLADVNASFIEMWFPTDFPDKVGIEEFVQWLLQVSEKVPITSGYCSLGFNREDWAALETDPLVRAQAARHPGMDVHETMHTAIRIGDNARGAYWMTFLSEQLVARLDLTIDTVRQRLGPEITVYPLPNGIAIRAGEKPEPGDRNRGDILPLIRRVAALIEPVQHIQTVAILSFKEVSDFVDWQRRHLL